MAKSGPKPGETQFVDCRDFTLGTNVLDDPSQLQNGETPYSLNMDITRNGQVVTRFGYDLAATIGGGATGPMRGLHSYYKSYDDNTTVDQSQDKTAAYANTYTLPVTPISEAAGNKCTFTPVYTGVVKIAVYMMVKGTGDWTLTLHNAANTTLAQYTIANAQISSQWNYFIVPYTWTSGALHFHLTSTVADGTIKTNVAADLSTASFIETYSTKGDYLLLHHSNGNSYFVTNSNFTPTLIGSYGADNASSVGSVTFNNYAIFGNGYASNQLQKWNAVTLANIGGSPPPVKRFSVFQNRLFAIENPWGTSTAYFSDPADETTLAKNFVTVNVGDGTDLTAMIPNNDVLQLYKTNTIHAMNFNFDSSYNLTIPAVQPIVSAQGGAVSGSTVQGVFGYTYFLSRKNVESYGPTPFRLLANQPLPLSLKITPIIQSINFTQTDNMGSIFTDDKYILSVPTNGSTLADTVLVYNESVRRRFNNDNFMIWTGMPVQKFASFRDATKQDQVYFTSNTEPKLYRFNKLFSDNGFGYNRIWRSKTFRFGERTEWKYLDLEGGKVQNGIMYVDLYMDGSLVYSIPIDNTNFILAGSTGASIGYDYIGTDYVGGGAYASAPPMFAWKKRIWWPDTANYGYQAYFQIRNNLDGHGWALSRYVLAYVQDPEVPSYSRTD